MQHFIASSSTPTTAPLRVEPARRVRDQSNDSPEDALSGFKGIATGVLLSVALWVLLLGLYFLI